MRPAILCCLLATPAIAQQTPPAAPAATECQVCPPLVAVPPGRFQMGSAADAPEADPGTGETPGLAITLARPFQVASREITVAEFRRYVEATGAEPGHGCRIWSGGGWIQDRERSWRDPGFAQPPRDDDPVVCISWEDARGYAQWLASVSGKRYRLPSEAEWEYVARGGTPFPRFWGERDSGEDEPLARACEFANVYDAGAVDALRLPWPNARCNDHAVALAPVAQYQPNAFGVYDIIGNAREWVMDCYTGSHAGRPEDGRAWTWQGGCELRVVRGGSWASRPRSARAPARGSAVPSLRQSDLGFRVVRDAG